MRVMGKALKMELREHKSSFMVYVTLKGAGNPDDDLADFQPQF